MAPFGIELLEPSTFVVQTINGLQAGFVLFLIASGLTVILGILDVLNLAHGELYALGAFISSSITGFLLGEFITVPRQGGQVVFDPTVAVLAILIVVVGSLLAALLMLPIGAFMEAVFIRPIYERDQVYQLVLTFALLLIIADLIEFVWGSSPQQIPFDYTITINKIPTFGLVGFGEVPSLVFFVIVIGILVGVALFWFFNRTKTGRIIRATAIDREMAQALGVSPDRTFTLVFAFGAFLAGFAGSMQMIQSSATPGMGESALVLSFVVIVVGGLGSLKGAVVGALVVGILQNWMVVLNPQLQTAAPFIVMVVVLLVKPEGLFGTWGERT